MTTQAIFFDLDDTLCDFQSGWKPAVQSAFDLVVERHPHLDHDQLRTAFAESWSETLPSLRDGSISMATARSRRFPDCFSRLGIEDDELCEETNLLLGRTLLDHLSLFSDVSCLELLRETWPLAIVTNGADDSHPDSQRSKVERLGLIDRVDGFFASDSWGMSKPDPRFLIRCAEEMGVEPIHTIFVGDSLEIDIAGANRAGMTSVLLWRRPEPPPEVSGDLRPRVVIHSLSELVHWIDFN